MNAAATALRIDDDVMSLEDVGGLAVREEELTTGTYRVVDAVLAQLRERTAADDEIPVDFEVVLPVPSPRPTEGDARGVQAVGPVGAPTSSRPRGRRAAATSNPFFSTRVVTPDPFAEAQIVQVPSAVAAAPGPVPDAPAPTGSWGPRAWPTPGASPSAPYASPSAPYASPSASCTVQTGSGVYAVARPRVATRRPARWPVYLCGLIAMTAASASFFTSPLAERPGAVRVKRATVEAIELVRSLT